MKIKIHVQAGEQEVIFTIRRAGEAITHERVFRLPPYDAEQLADLLRDTAKRARNPGGAVLMGRLNAEEVEPQD